MEQLKQEIKKEIEKRYGEINDTGANVAGRWLSTEQIYNLVCSAIDKQANNKK